MISVEFDGKKVIDTPPSISIFFNILKLAVLMIYFYLNLKILKEFSNFYIHTYKNVK